MKQVWTVDGWQDGGANCYVLHPFYHYFMFFLFASEVIEKVATEQGPDSAGSGTRRAVTVTYEPMAVERAISCS